MKKNTLASHNITFLFWANLLGNIRFLTPVLTLFYYQRGLDEATILTVMLFWSAGVLAGEVPTGIFADRFGAKKSFLAGSFLSLVSQLLLIWAFDPYVFFISSFISGFSATFFSGADEALIYESLKESGEESYMDKAMGILQSGQFAVAVIVGIIGAVLAKDLAEHQFKLLIILGLLFQSVQLVLLTFIKNPKGQGNYRDNPFNQVREGLGAIRRSPHLLWMFLNVTLVFIPAAAIFDNFDQKLLVEAGLPVYLIGIVYSIASIFSFFASRSIGWMTSKVSRVRFLFATGVAAAGCLLILSVFRSSLLLVLAVFFVLRFIRTVRYPVYAQLSNEIIPSNVRATTISLLSVLDSVCDIVIFGSLAGIAVYGFSPMFLICAVIAGIGSALPLTPKKEAFKLSA